ncbi:MAG: sugar phosphate isomerase/epimerase [Oscillospiraceae bacterium]|nr:sugar phosphate isomerase/epimerase [Oscillospiraceae bacterium]
MNIGAQMYTLRAHCQTLEDFERSMARVAAMGYRSAQISGGGDFAAPDIRAVADRCGVETPLTHTAPQKIKDETDAVIEAHRVMGARYIGIGMMPVEYQGGAARAERFIRDFTPAAAKIKAAGMKLMIHNHAFEFERFGGITVMERLADGFDPDAAGFTLDVYWAAYAGADPAFWLRKLSGRVDTVHFKDMAFVSGEQRMAPVGGGNLNWEAVVGAARESGVKWAFVEQDDCYGEDPFDCLERSLAFLTARL